MSDNWSVFVRCRPLGEVDRWNASLKIIEDTNQVKLSSKDYYFDKVFPQDSSQEEVYNAVVRPLIYQVLNGYNSTVFAYGQTGTGKTYTMEGDGADDRNGMVPRAVTHIFQTLRSRDVEFTIKVSFIEIYSEEVYDLLSTTEDTNKLRVLNDPQKQGSVVIQGVKEIVVTSETDVPDILYQGAMRRQTTATLLNAHSSRSHSIFTIAIDQGGTVGKLNLVDLAGSENIARSGAQDRHAREAGNINQSLLTLTRVITALVDKQAHVPYRESKLTRILQDSLGGSTRTSMIATISPAEKDLSNTVGTLDYAGRARCISNRVENNKPYLQKKSSEELHQLVQSLRDKHAEEMRQLEMKIRNEVTLEWGREMEKNKALIKESTEKEYVTRINEMKGQIESLEKEYEARINEMRGQTESIEKDQETKMNNLREELKKEYEGRIDTLNERIDQITRDLKIQTELVKVKDDIVKEIEMNLRLQILENQAMKKELEELEKQDKQERQEKPADKVPESFMDHDENVEHQDEDHENHVEVKKASKIRKRLPAQDDCNDYANMTFDGDDEIVQVSSKKPRRKVAVAGKKRDLYQAITLSGKKKRLKSTDEEAELSPISPPVRVTRSRATRRKLDY